MLSQPSNHVPNRPKRHPHNWAEDQINKQEVTLTPFERSATSRHSYCWVPADIALTLPEPIQLRA
jgi:hypothetical protein